MKIDFRLFHSGNALSLADLTGKHIIPMNLWRWSLVSLVLFVIALPAWADKTKSRPLTGIVGFESATGGNNVGSLATSSSDAGDVKAGSGMHFYLGMIYKPVTVFEARLNAGYQMDRSPTSNGTIFMDRYTFEFTPTLCYKSHRLGAGVTYHTNIKLHTNDFGRDDVLFKNALGYTIEYGYKIAPFLYFGLRYVELSYDIENAGVALNGKRTVNANHVGINLYYQY
jgi:hypothetical protein